MSTGKGAFIATPTTFHGEQSEADQFILEVEIYMKGKPQDFLDGITVCKESKIMFALSYMKGGTADSWAERYMKREQFDATANPHQACGMYQHTTYVDFIKEFQEAFKEHNKGQTVHAHLDALSQGHHSVDIYTQLFNKVSHNIGCNEEAMQHAYL